MKILTLSLCLFMCAAAGVGGCDDESQPVLSRPDAAVLPTSPKPTTEANAPVVNDVNAAGAVNPEADESEVLPTESPEQDPESQTVKLKLDVSPHSAHAVVWWGKQKLGEAPITIERPRRSGPLNLVVKADGFLDHHTRLFTDRDDKLAVSLVRPREAGGMLGFKRKPGMGPSASESGVPGSPESLPASDAPAPSASPSTAEPASLGSP